MRALADVLLQVRAGDAHARQAAVEFELDVAVGRGRLVVLRDLVILRHVRVKITFPVELREAGYLAIEQETGEHRQAQCLVVRHGQHAGQAEADGADVRVRRRAECIGAPAPHLRFCFKLDVGFQADDRFVFHKRADSLTMDGHGVKPRGGHAAIRGCTRIFQTFDGRFTFNVSAQGINAGRMVGCSWTPWASCSSRRASAA